MILLDAFHGAYVARRRCQVLAEHIDLLLPRDATVLDVGCGDGRLARRIMDRRGDVNISGVDVLVRGGTSIPVTPGNGTALPHAARSVDVVLLIDVLHHTDDPDLLLAEAARVARQAVIIKDHTSDGPASALLLRVMDWIGNARYGVRLPYNYWSRQRWVEAFAVHGLGVESWSSELALYPVPASWLLDRSLHFIAKTRPRGVLATRSLA